MDPNTSFRIRNHLLAFALLIVCSVALYLNALSGPFVYDDKQLILTNVKIKDWSQWSDVVGDDFWSVTLDPLQSGYYRPIITLSYMLNYALSELDPYGYHVTNLYVHIANVLLVYWFVFLIFQRQWPTLVAGLLFATHPMHTESVTWIAGRTDVIATFFFLLALVLWSKTLVSWNRYRYTLALFCYLTALFTKEVALVLPLILILYDYLLHARGRWREVWTHFPRYHLPFFLLSFCYPLLKFWTLGVLVGSLPLYAKTRLLAILNAFKLLFYYFQLLLFPLSFNVERDVPVINTIFSGETFGYLCWGLLLFSIILFTRKRLPLLSFSLAWIVITLFPVLNIIPIGDYIAERFLYLPSVGFVLGIASFWPFLSNVSANSGPLTILRLKNLSGEIKSRGLLLLRGGALVLFVSLVMFYSIQTIRRNGDWQNEIRLWTQTLSQSPTNIRVHILLANAYYENGQIEEALRLYRQALSLNPPVKELYPVLGDVYYRLRRIDEAITEYQALLERFPDHEKAHKMLGLIWREKQQYAKAIHHFQQAMSFTTEERLPDYHLLMGLVYQEQGNLDQALEEYEQARRLIPEMAKAYAFLWSAYKAKGIAEKIASESQQAFQTGQAESVGTYYYAGAAYEEQGAFSQALKVYQAALQIAPRSAFFYERIGEMYERLGEMDQAEAAYKEALKYNFTNASIHYRLGTIYTRKGLLEQAIPAYERVLLFDPHHPKAQQDLAMAYYDLGMYYRQTQQKEEAVRCYQNFLRYWQGDTRYTLLAQNYLKELRP